MHDVCAGLSADDGGRHLAESDAKVILDTGDGGAESVGKLDRRSAAASTFGAGQDE